MEHRTLIYVADIVVFSRTSEEHVDRLHQVLTRLEENNLTLNPKKCNSAMTQINFLGHVVSKAGILPDPDKIQAVKEYKTPNTRCQLLRAPPRSFADLHRPILLT